ncbi:MAG: hypothetical protein OEU84_08875 [Xanthomonadales bacterium]|nr:hypothetical protein [Xanthomonadales bacterium]
MLHRSVITIALAIFIAVASLPLAAQTENQKARPENVPELLVKANTAYAEKDYLAFSNAMERLRMLRPYNGGYMYQSVIAYALLDEKSKAYDLMVRMQQQGLGYDFDESPETMNIRGTQVYDYVNDIMKMAANPLGETDQAFILPESVSLPEAITWDESRQKFLVGTATEGSIIAVDKDGQVAELLKANDENGLWAVLDLLVDTSRNRLWVTSAAIPAFSRFEPVDKGRSALFEFDLESLELIHRYPVPVDGMPHTLGSMVLSPNGDIFMADRTLPIIYRKPADEQKIQPAVALQGMVSMRGIAIQPDGGLLYVADREMGIMVVDIKNARSRLLKVPATLNVGGIDGLYLKDNHLFMIQNGNMPQRVMRLELDPEGIEVVAVRPMVVSQPEFDFPSFGTLHSENLYFFANSQTSANAGSNKAVTVLSTPLESSEDLAEPDFGKYLKQAVKDSKQSKEN